MYDNRIRPRFGKVPTAVGYSGCSKSRLYEWGAEHAGLFRKNGASTLIDFDVLDQILDSLPIADIKASTKSVTAKSAKDSDDKKPGQTVGSERKLLAPKLKTSESPRAKSASTSSTATDVTITDDLAIPPSLRRANPKCEENDR
jgi:hypothetical protein